MARAQSPSDWAQIFVFPEGTTTNGKVLIRFQTGAFRPGTPVQPLIIKYSNPLVTTWTKVGGGLEGFLKSILVIMATPISNISVEFLPVYHPSSTEQENPRIFAKNVQNLMADKLQTEVFENAFGDQCIWYIELNSDIDNVTRNFIVSKHIIII